MMNEDMELVRQYAAQGSEEAFSALVSRHVNLVYSVALRRLNDVHLAEEITQAAFIIFARKAKSLGANTIVSAWLCRTAQFLAARALRDQYRRRLREQEIYMQSRANEPDSQNAAWTEIAPLLDLAMADLNEKDHSAIVLRYFEGKDLKAIGAALGVSENAAKTRASRAMEKLRRFFLKRGITKSSAAIAGAISANSIQAAPVALATSAASIALANGASASLTTLTLAKGALKIMAWTKAQTAITGVLIAGLAAYSVIQHEAQARLRAQNVALQQQIDGLAQLANDNQDLSRLLAQAKTTEAIDGTKLNEYLREHAREPKPAPQPAAIPEPAPPVQAPADATVKFPRDSWTNSGFATPEATLKTRAWAILNGDRQQFAQSVSLTDGARKMIEDQLVQMAAASKDPDAPRIIQQALAEKWGAEEAILMPMMAENQQNPYTGYQIISQQSPSPDEVGMEVQTDRASSPSKTETLKFQRVGGDWKILIDEATVQEKMRQ